MSKMYKVTHENRLLFLFILFFSKLTYINNRVRLMLFRKFCTKQNRMNYLKEDTLGIFTCLAESDGRINTNFALVFNIAIGCGLLYHNYQKYPWDKWFTLRFSSLVGYSIYFVDNSKYSVVLATLLLSVALSCLSV